MGYYSRIRYFTSPWERMGEVFPAAGSLKAWPVRRLGLGRNQGTAAENFNQLTNNYCSKSAQPIIPQTLAHKAFCGYFSLGNFKYASYL